jgi:transcriptional regulator with XRE-family HTH domain
MTQYGAAMAADNAELAARIRAACAYSPLTHAEIATATGIKVGTLRGYTSTARTNVPSMEHAKAIAAACLVPPQFMEVGFAPLEQPISDVERRLYELEETYSQRLAELEAAVRQLSDGALPAPRGQHC